MSPQARWRKAIRRVITNIRRNKNQVALSRFRVPRGTSISERLERLEDGLFSVPIGIQEEVRKQAEEAAERAQRDTETLDLKLKNLQMQLTEQQEKAQTLSAAVANSIFEVKTDCSNLDRTCADLDRAVSKLAAIRSKLSQKVRQPSQEMKPLVDKAASSMTVASEMLQRAESTDATLSPTADVSKVAPLVAVSALVGGEGGHGDEGVEALASKQVEKVALVGPDLFADAVAAPAVSAPTPFSDSQDVEDDEIDAAADNRNAMSSEDGERIERDLESLNRRMNSTERFHAQSLRGKLQNLQTEVSALQDSAALGVRRLQRLKDESLLAADASADALSAGQDVSSLMQLDEDIKDARHALRTLDLRVVALKDWQKGLRAEIACSAAQASTQGGYDSPRTFGSEQVKKDMLKVCDDLLAQIEGASSSLKGHDGAVVPYSATLTQQLVALMQDMNNSQLQHQANPQPSVPSSDLSPSAGAPKLMSAPAPTPMSAALNTAALAKIKKDINARPTVEDVRVISREGIEGAMAAALEPLRSTIDSLYLEIQGLKGSVGDVRATAETDRQEVRLLGKDIQRMGGEGEKDRERAIAYQIKQDAEQKARSEVQRSVNQQPPNNEVERNRIDEDNRRRKEEETSKSAVPKRVEEVQTKYIPVYLPPGVVACVRNQIEMSDPNGTGSGGHGAVSGGDGKSYTAASAGGGAQSTASLGVNANVIAVGATVNITSGSHSGKQGSVVDIYHAAESSDPSSSAHSATQYLVNVEQAPESVTPFKSRMVTLPTTSHPVHKRRDSEERAAPRIQIEMMKMRDEIQQMEVALNSLSRDKINAYQVQQMIDLKTSSMGNAHDKVDTESFLSVEAVVRNLASELEDLRHMQGHRLATLKKQFDESLRNMNMSQAGSVEQQEQGTFSSVITTGQCLGCGRLSAIHSNSLPSSGPETFRAGFRMPLVPAPFRALAVPPAAIGGFEAESATSSVPISAVMVSKSVDLSGNQHTTLESMNLSFDSSLPQYCPTRPRTSSKCP